MSVIFDQVVGDVREGGGGGTDQPVAPAPPPRSDENSRARLRADLRMLARREARTRAT